MKPPILACFLFICVNAFSANKSSTPGDTTHVKYKPWKISEMEFIDRYGKDDTSRALIDYYFHKRRGGRHTMLYGAIGNVTFTTIAALILTSDVHSASFLVLEALPFLLLAEVGLIALIIGFSSWLSRSRRKLLQLLNDYRSGKPISTGMKTNSIFLKYLEMEKHLPTK